MRLGAMRDLLDKQLVDAENRPIGKVDGLIVQPRGDRPPLVTYIECGGATLSARLPGVLRRIMRWLATRLSPKEAAPYRIAMEHVVHLGVNVKLDLDASSTPALASERWVRDHIIARIPGA